MRVLKILIFLFIGLLVGLETGGKACAGASVSVSGGNWAIGTVQGEEVVTSGTEGPTPADDKWTVTGSSDGTEDVYIKVTGTNWAPAAASGTNQFILKHDVSGSWGAWITNSDNGIELIGSLEVSGTQDFDLQFTAPSSGNEGVEQTLTVTLTATNWVEWEPPPCAGYYDGEHCWYLGGAGESCDTVCGSHGASCVGIFSAPGCVVHQQLIGKACASCRDNAGTWYPYAQLVINSWICYTFAGGTCASNTAPAAKRLCVCDY